MKCLCCNKVIKEPNEYEQVSGWHGRCVKRFFGLSRIPLIDISEEQLEKLAESNVNKGLTVPGVQKKMSLHLERNAGEGRFTIVGYPTGYILKPQSNDFRALPEAEFLSMKLAEIAGINTVPNGLIRLAGKYAYITKRIDRQGDEMYAMEDFCQLSNRVTADKYKGSYEGCGKIIDRYSKNVGVDKVEYFYRLLFCFVTGNSDMHLKNFSLIENSPSSRFFGLSAAYDMLPVNVIMPEDKEQMALTLNGRKKNIRRKDFLALAENLGIPIKTSEKLISKISGYKTIWIEETNASLIPRDMKEELIKLVENRVDGLFVSQTHR